MTISILDALAKQKETNPYIHRERLIMEDGLLEIHDEVFKCTMYQLGFDKEEAEGWMLEPVEMRGTYIGKWCDKNDSDK